ncbi:MAG TPA: glycosyltransferase [Pyrinomonadaceae bacterium]
MPNTLSATNGMNRHYDFDAFPGKPRILFVGLGENSHTHSWIDLLEGAPFNVRLFSMPSGNPPDDWPVRTYITSYENPPLNAKTRTRLYPATRPARFAKRLAGRAFGMPNLPTLAGRWLASIIRQWQPDIIHTLGIVQGGEFYLEMRRKFRLEGIGKWVLQTRGGSDLTLPHLDPERRKQLSDVLGLCDQLICDNEEDLRIARELGLRTEQRAPIAPVPGTGGIDVESLRQNWQGSPSSRRAIVWPKAYDSAWGKMLPTFEALKLCWDRIQPCEVHLLSMTDESFMWFWTLPEDIRRSCRTYKRIPRSEVLRLMPRGRIMLAPALADGVPNSLYEGMAAGALPIVSPLATILPVVKSEENVLFARNLYPHEIAEAIGRAMTDDALVNAVAERNLELVRRIAGREAIRTRVIEYYEGLARGNGRHRESRFQI